MVLLLKNVFTLLVFKNNIKTYSDWGAGWNQQTTEKEKNLPSPYLQKEFEKDKKVKIFPVELKDDALNLYKNFLTKTIK